MSLKNRNDRQLLTLMGWLITMTAFLLIGARCTRHSIQEQLTETGQAYIDDGYYACKPIDNKQ